jgi:hypothetical protein
MDQNLSALSTTQLEFIAIARHGPDAKLIAASFSKRAKITRQGWMKAAQVDPAECEGVRDERWQMALQEKPRWIP